MAIASFVSNTCCMTKSPCKQQNFLYPEKRHRSIFHNVALSLRIFRNLVEIQLLSVFLFQLRKVFVYLSIHRYYYQPCFNLPCNPVCDNIE